MQVVDNNGNVFGGGLQVNGPDGKPKTSSGGGSPSGPAGGDLSGSYPNPGVVWGNGLPTYDLQYYPLSLNPAGYLNSISGSMVTSALGYTPYDTSNPAGYIDSSALTPYLTSATAAATYQPLLTLTTTGSSGPATLTGSTLNIPQYGGSSSLTVGTTAITSGTVGRILFEGTGNVLQQSANLFWDNTNGRLGIGTATPSSFLNVVSSSATIPSLLISGTNPYSGSPVRDYITINGTGNVGISLITNTGGFVAQRFYSGTTELGVFYCQESTKDFVFKNSQTGFMDFQTGGNISRLRIFNGGNIAIGTTTDAGFKLDVNGTARVRGGVQTGAIYGSGTNFNLASDAYIQCTSTTGKNAGLTINRFSTSEYASVDLITNASFVSGWSIQMVPSQTRLNIVDRNPSDNVRMCFHNGGNIGIGTTTNAGYKLDVNGSSRFLDKVSIGSPTAASAVLEISSTIQGFLPPRMTTAQKNAIASPAAGLVVYDTTLNKLCVRTASAWETITSV